MIISFFVSHSADINTYILFILSSPIGISNLKIIRRVNTCYFFDCRWPTVYIMYNIIQNIVEVVCGLMSYPFLFFSSTSILLLFIIITINHRSHEGQLLLLLKYSNDARR